MSLFLRELRVTTQGGGGGQVASAVLNSDGFNPSSGCASALVGVDCSGAGGRLVVLNTPASICAEAAVAEASTKPENGYPPHSSHAC